MEATKYHKVSRCFQILFLSTVEPISLKSKLQVERFPPSNDERLNLGHSTTGGEQPGPIRIRNLEDLIRQLEHSSRHLSSSPGSDEMGGGDHDRHFRYRNIA